MGHRSYVGQSPPRREDPGLVAGAHRYVADIVVPGCLDAVFVRSFEAHGLLNAVDLAAAQSMEGIVGAYSAGELPDLPVTPAPPRAEVPPEMSWPALARDRVRFAGQPIAVVLAADRYTAEDGAELVFADIDPLEAVIDPGPAASDEVMLFEPRSNVVSVREFGAPVDDVMDSAPVVVETIIRNERLCPTSIETRGIVVVPDGDDITVHVSHQAPQRLRQSLARSFGIEAELVRVIVPHVGGAFGAKSQTYPEYIVIAHLARKLGRPVRWIEDRREAFAGATHGRGQTQRLRLAADREGNLLALEALVDADIGAYPHTGEFIAANTGWMLSGPYTIPHLHVRVRAVVTNTTPTAAYRGAGRPEAAYALERALDRLAHRLGADPAELRLRNFIDRNEFPYRSPTGAVYDSGDHAAALRLALERAGYDDARAEQRRRRTTGDGNPLGIGIGSYIERSGGQEGSTEFGSVTIEPDGTVVARSGATPQGQGHATAFAQVVASALEVELDRVSVIQGDTDEVPVGVGTFGSRSMQVGGSSLHHAAHDALEEARLRASAHLEVAEADLRYDDGRFTVVGTDRSVTLGQLATERALSAQAEFGPPQAFPFGTYVAVVELDRDTGDISLEKLVAVDDCGIVINPKLVEGQSVGSIIQGIGQALYEQVVFDEYGQPLMSSLMDYSLPTVAELPELVLDQTVTPNPNVPLGNKGAGEAGCIGTPPAIVNAIVDALGGRDEGIDLPVTPEKVWLVLSRSD
ncbi:MAG: molybdopterin-dependent oxidoreductase [Actinobacteria bacterium]|nr:molybdopterin-dependent oxidoreductase [Actinomycetota bacterium]